MRKIHIALLSFIAICASALVEQSASAAEINFQLNWRPTAGFAGYYQAQKSGGYLKHDLKVKFLHGGPKVDPIESVVSGKAQFGLTGAKRLLKARAAGKPVRAIAAINRRSPIVFISLKKLGIVRPQQFVGHKIRATPDLVPTLRAIMRQVSVPDNAYEIVSLPSKVDLFEKGDVPIWGAHISGMALKLQQRGHDLNIIFPSDYGLESLSGVIFSTDAYLEANKQTATDFLAASLTGIQQVIEDTSKAGPLVKIYNPDTDVAFQNARMESSIPLIHTGEDSIGWMKPESWKNIVAFQKQQGELPNGFSAKDIYSLEYLKRIQSR